MICHPNRVREFPLPRSATISYLREVATARKTRLINVASVFGKVSSRCKDRRICSGHARWILMPHYQVQTPRPLNINVLVSLVFVFLHHTSLERSTALFRETFYWRTADNSQQCIKRNEAVWVSMRLWVNSSNQYGFRSTNAPNSCSRSCDNGQQYIFWTRRLLVPQTGRAAAKSYTPIIL